MSNEIKEFIPYYIRTEMGFKTLWEGTWLGGHVLAPNTTQGFHGILIFWLEQILNNIDSKNSKNILLSSENKSTRFWFENRYTNQKHKFVCTDISGNVDVKYDMNKNYEDIHQKFNNEKFDIIFSQAQLEHLTRPDNFLLNCLNLLKEDGFIILMTQGTKFEYHNFPRNYMHFFKDYFEDIHIENEENMLELYDYIQESKTKETKIICALFRSVKKPIKEKS